MRKISIAAVGAYSFVVLGLGMAGTGWGQDLIPEGPGRDQLIFVCTQCHSVDRITNARLSADDWEFILYDMIARGAPVYQRDIDNLKKYLIDNFASDQK